LALLDTAQATATCSSAERVDTIQKKLIGSPLRCARGRLSAEQVAGAAERNPLRRGGIDTLRRARVLTPPNYYAPRPSFRSSPPAARPQRRIRRQGRHPDQLAEHHGSRRERQHARREESGNNVLGQRGTRAATRQLLGRGRAGECSISVQHRHRRRHGQRRRGVRERGRIELRRRRLLAAPAVHIKRRDGSARSTAAPAPALSTAEPGSDDMFSGTGDDWIEAAA